MTGETTIYLRDCRPLGYCSKGVRNWFLAQGLGEDGYRSFVKNGAPASLFTRTGDAQGVRLVEETEKRRGRSGEK